MEALDFPDLGLLVPTRGFSASPLQSLALLNNPFMVKQAEYFAERVQKMDKEPAKQVDAAYRLAFGRSPLPPERRALTVYVQRHGLANACRLLLNANEFFYLH